MTQQISGNAEAENPRQAQSEAQPSDRVDGISKQNSCQQGHQQRLGVDEHGAEAGSRSFEATGEQSLEEAGIHQREQEKPAQITTINPP